TGSLAVDFPQAILHVGGGTIQDWDAGLGPTIQISTENTIYGPDGQIGFVQNARFDDTDNRWEFVVNAGASSFYSSGGSHYFRVTAAGVADNPITWTTALTLATTGAATFSSTVVSGGFTVGTLTIADGSIDDTDGSIAFGATDFTGVGTIECGHIGIGVAPDANYVVDIYGDNAGDAIMRLKNDGNNHNRYGISMWTGADAWSADVYQMLFYDGNGTWKGGVQWVNGTTSFEFVETSDVKLKGPVCDTSMNGLDIIKGIRIRNYSRIATPEQE
ncbi:unnamed protein product, partial [marine sediment metagenome]